MKCELCDQPASFHVTDTDGEVVTERHLCEAHVRSTGLPVPDEAEMVQEKAAKLRRLVDLIRDKGRMPTREELAGLGFAGEFLPVDPGGPAFQEQLTFLENVVSFAETQGRFPTEEEVGPDPF